MVAVNLLVATLINALCSSIMIAKLVLVYPARAPTVMALIDALCALDRWPLTVWSA